MSDINLDSFPETIICDIDGCILEHTGMKCITEYTGEILEGVREQFWEWSDKGNKIIILTARKESTREETIKQLKSFGLFWDELIMGATRGRRVLINDKKPGKDQPTAIAINLERNRGF